MGLKKSSKDEILAMLRCPHCGGSFSNDYICGSCSYRLRKKSSVFMYKEFLTDEMIKEDNLNKKLYTSKKKTIKEKAGERNYFVASQIISFLKKKHMLLRYTRVLELGGYDGWLSSMISKHTPYVYNTDISYCLLKNSSTDSFLIPMQNIDDIFKPKSFDIVWVNAALHHCKDFDVVFKAVREILKPHGLFIISNDLIVGLMESHKKDIDEAQSSGAQDRICHLHDYIISAKNNSFSCKLMVPPDVLEYYEKHPQEIKTRYKRKLFVFIAKLGLLRLLKLRFFELLYMAVAELFGTPVLVLCKKT